MGKIADALTKRSIERKDTDQPSAPPLPVLSDADTATLSRYDRETGHLLAYSRESGQVDRAEIERLRQEGTIQRLLDHRLIYPTGKLTPRGIEAAERAARDHVRTARPAPDPAGAEIVSLDFPAPEPAAPAAPPPEPAPEPTASTVRRPEPPRPAPEPKAAPARRAETPQPTPRVEALAPPERPLPQPSPSIDREACARVDRSLIALLQPNSPESEQFKILRTNLLYPVAGQPPRSILVTSAGMGEGKTFTATNLAISVALNINKHVLLIDADLRRPQVHRRFGLQEPPGLSEYLSDIRPLSSLLVKTPVPKLTLLTGGRPPENPSELISSERMSDLLQEVTQRYPDRLVVIDAPPPALAAETAVLARRVDGVLAVVRFCSTRDEALTDLIARVGEQKILGTVINYIQTPATRYYGYSHNAYLRRDAVAPA